MTMVCPSIHLMAGFSYEDVIVQIQPYTKEILCVKNGEELLVFSNLVDVPSTLQLEHATGNMIWYYRCSMSDDLYAFFMDIHHQDKDKVYGTINEYGKMVPVINSTTDHVEVVISAKTWMS